MWLGQAKGSIAFFQQHIDCGAHSSLEAELMSCISDAEYVEVFSPRQPNGSKPKETSETSKTSSFKPERIDDASLRTEAAIKTKQGSKKRKQ
jgi:hypothetical protein